MLREPLENEESPRATWERGVVMETYPGKDGLVRVAKVKTGKGEYTRPIHKMCLIATKEELDNAVVD
jgi:hypothetical protein